MNWYLSLRFTCCFQTEKEIAETLKTELDEKFGGPWHVIVGKKFGGRVTYIPSKKRIIS